MEISQPSVLFFRLVTGEDLISLSQEIPKDEENNAYFLMKNPMKIVYMQNPLMPSKMAISLMQWVFGRICETQEFKVFETDIITISQPSPSLMEYYSEAVTALETKPMVDLEEPETFDEDDLEDDSDILKTILEHIDPIKRTIH